ncbi:helix-turn-helix transcriptional regulator [Vallitalea pronyensis]|uniref:Helix-turn-helix transcriptional regulator n=1 Tax=Vallitalea pronyensis TaxID=1348613 RepID=A0A8J8MHR9_9FIRM|nr:helix-turn-helix transcriptional regulator [Vallitalea pronyensis]QUI21885.1 helix-turn-helix transcriptional regulator [Vallitalea pronyensis]
MMDNIYKKAGLRIRKLRELNNLTREAFSEIADISPKFLYEIETGQKGFSADTLYRIAKGLCVTTEYILTGNDNQELSEELLSILGLFDNSQLEALNRLLNIVYELSARTS